MRMFMEPIFEVAGESERRSGCPAPQFPRSAFPGLLTLRAGSF
jgi:hypothetical protein